MSTEQLMSRLADQQKQKAAQQEAARNGTGNADYTGVLSLKFGDQNVFILPPFAQGQDLHLAVWLHFGFTDAQGNNVVYQCSKGKHGSCPICDSVAHLKDSKNKQELDQYQSICAKKFYIYNVLDGQGQNKILCAKSSQQDAIDAEIIATYNIDKTDITNMNGGRWLMVSRLKSQPWCRVRTLPQPYVLTAEQQAGVRAKMKDLSTYYKDYTPAELTNILRGGQAAAAPVQAAAPAPVAQVAPQPAPVAMAPQPVQVAPAPQAYAAPAPQTFPTPVASAPAPMPMPVSSAPTPVVNHAPVAVNAGAMTAQEILAKLNS